VTQPELQALQPLPVATLACKMLPSRDRLEVSPQHSLGWEVASSLPYNPFHMDVFTKRVGGYSPQLLMIF